MKKKYLAPGAEIIYFAPCENIAAWKPWFQPGDSWWINTLGLGEDDVQGASITGGALWYESFDENGNIINSELD